MKIQNNVVVNGQKVVKLIQAESYADFLQWMDANRPKFESRNNGGNGTSARFCGTASYADARDLAMNGWIEGLQKTEALMARVENRLFSMLKHRRMEYHFAGGVPDVGVFLANQPEYFMGQEFEEKHAQGKLARIVVNVSTSATFSTDQMIARGVAVLAVVDAMERQGRSCEIIATQAVDSHGRWEIEIPLKRNGQSLEIERLAFVLAHPSFLRRYIFGAEDICDMRNNSYGMPSETFLDHGDLYFGAMSYDQCPQDDDGLLAWVLKMLASQGIELEDA